jgi:hypothetical protein
MPPEGCHRGQGVKAECIVETRLKANLEITFDSEKFIMMKSAMKSDRFSGAGNW